VDRHARAKALYLECCGLDGSARARVLARGLGGDEALRGEVEAMLDFDARRPHFLEPAAAARAAPQALPTRIGKFRILGRIGEGGMGTVFEAEQEHPRRVVALKLLRLELSSPRLQRRFAREVELLGRLQHPGIARLYEAGQVETELGPLPWLSMERIEGVALTAWARAHPDLRVRLELFAEVCRAVQHAHERGVVHRDLKPANLLVDEAGRAHVLDFGIARALDADLGLTTQHHGAGEILGTLAYMSPEQAAGDSAALDARSDVYSLGVILHELLAGELPYPMPESSLVEAVAAIQTAQPRRLGSVQRALRGDLETIASTALEKDPGRRYASAGALGADVERFLRDEPIQAHEPSRAYVLARFVRRNRGSVVSVGAVFLALVVGLVAALRFGLGEAEQRARADRRTADALELAHQASLLATQTLLDAGSFDAARQQLGAVPPAMRGWAWGALDRRLDGRLAELVLPGLWDAAFLDDERVLLVDESGAALAWDLVTDQRTPYGPSVPGARPLVLTEDGRRLLSSLGAELVLSDPLGAEVARLDFPGGEPAHGWRRAAIAPGDGGRLAVATADDALWLWEPGAGRWAELPLPDGKIPWSLAFSPDGELLAVGTNRLLALYECAHASVRWEKRTNTVFHGLCFDPAGGQLIAGWEGGLRFFDLASGKARETWSPNAIKTQGMGTPFDLALVPGGRLLAVVFAGGNQWLMDLDTRAVLTTRIHPGFKTVSVAVAPRGDVLLTCGRADGAVRVWDARPRPADVFQGESGSIYPLSISPDGALIATGSWDGQARIWEIRSGRQIAALPHGGHVDALDFSPDGRRLACGSGKAGLYLWDARSGAALAHARDRPASVLVHSPEGARLAIGHGAAVSILDARTLEPLLEIGTGAPALTALAWSPDGKLVAGGAKSGHLRLWDAVSGVERGQFRGNERKGDPWGGLRSVAFSPDVTRLATAWGTSKLLLLHVPELTLQRELVGHAQQVFDVAWSPDGQRLASGGRDNRLRVWNPDTGGLLLDLAAHEDYIFSLAFTPDGRCIATGSGDGTVRLWDSAPAVLGWRERALAGRDRQRLAPLVAGLFEELAEPGAVAERIADLPGLTDGDRRLAWDLVLEHAAPAATDGSETR